MDHSNALGGSDDLDGFALGAIERSWASVILPSFAGAPSGALVASPSEVDYPAAFERFMGKATPKARFGIRVALLLVMSAPLWLTFRPRSFRSLDPEARSALLDRLLEHPIFFVRELCLLVKLAACMAIFRSHEARARSGYDGDPAPRDEVRRRRPLPLLSEKALLDERAEVAR